LLNLRYIYCLVTCQFPAQDQEKRIDEKIRNLNKREGGTVNVQL